MRQTERFDLPDNQLPKRSPTRLRSDLGAELW